jgi:hypothetical protein
MPDEHSLTLRQADQARSDFAFIETELETIHARSLVRSRPRRLRPPTPGRAESWFSNDPKLPFATADWNVVEGWRPELGVSQNTILCSVSNMVLESGRWSP